MGAWTYTNTNRLALLVGTHADPQVVVIDINTDASLRCGGCGDPMAWHRLWIHESDAMICTRCYEIRHRPDGYTRCPSCLRATQLGPEGISIEIGTAGRQVHQCPNAKNDLWTLGTQWRDERRLAHLRTAGTRRW